mmetsp:Transcript_10136/g.18995  ORF Transcript_10136/g.18995 Transcript_10136/m.18995 type:complete len:664 (+) Transcript_10136:230-2221(+)
MKEKRNTNSNATSSQLQSKSPGDKRWSAKKNSSKSSKLFRGLFNGGLNPSGTTEDAQLFSPPAPAEVEPVSSENSKKHQEMDPTPLSPAPSSDSAKEARGMEIVDTYLKDSRRGGLDDDVVQKTYKKNTKKLDQFGFIVNLDDRGALRDDRSVDIPGGAYTPSPDTPKQYRNHRRRRSRTMTKREKIHLDNLNKRREKKWLDMLQQWTSILSNKPKAKKLRQRIRKGIPNSVRGQAWTKLAKVQEKVNKTQVGMYAKLVALSCEMTDEVAVGSFEPNVELNVDNSVTKETIERDLTRTFPRHNMFYDSGGEDDDDDDDESSIDDDSTDGSFDKLSHSGSFDSLSQHSGSGAEEGCSGNSGSAGIIGDQEEQVDENIEVVMDSATRDGDAEYAESSDSNTPNEACRMSNGCPAMNIRGKCPPIIFTDTRENSFEPIQPQTVTKRSKKVKPPVDFSNAEGGLAKLRRVLRAYSVYDSEVGYCQGMNFIAAMFITFVDEEEAFWLLVHVMNEAPCRMRGLFGEGMSEAHVVLHIADRLINQFHPRLAKHFDREQIHISMFATQWLLTMYTSSFPFDVVTRVWDAFLSEGWKVAYRVMLGLLEMSQSLLMKMKFEDILNYFKEMPFEIDSNDLMELSFKIPLKNKHITKYAKEYERRQKKKLKGKMP